MHGPCRGFGGIFHGGGDGLLDGADESLLAKVIPEAPNVVELTTYRLQGGCSTN